MEIGAHLYQLELSSPDPQAIANFYRDALKMEVSERQNAYLCQKEQRRLVIHKGEPNQLVAAVLRFHTETEFQHHQKRLEKNGISVQHIDNQKYQVVDPEGRNIFFTSPGPGEKENAKSERQADRLQHFAVRTPAPESLVDFYVNQLGFTLSDRVEREDGELTAAFLRIDNEHHAMAIFRAEKSCFDHFSCETQDWETLREWADYLAKNGISLHWGIGRHGPGNDTFLMVKDADGNLAEISCDLEVCSAEREIGHWLHLPQTLNQWGVALMRS